MRIVDETGDIFDSGSEILVNPVNCVGVMGKGLALEFAKLFPTMVPEYKKACELGVLIPGKCWIWEVPIYSKRSLQYDFKNLKYIVNFPTKNHWRFQSKISWIRQGLGSLALDLKNPLSKGYLNQNSYPTSISFPALGCSLGGLQWEEVRPLIIENLKNNFNWFEEVKLYSPYK
jgi:O-acetyl-ADP-ribose deacetylase (regulator of RNase III)